MLTDYSIFDQLSPKDVNNIIDKATIRKYKKNHILIFQESDLDMVYIVKSGLLKVFRMYEDKELILGLINKGSVIGELELFADEKAISSVEIIQEAEIYSFTKDNFGEIANTYPQIMKNIFQIYNQRFKQLNEQIQQLSFKNVLPRICNLLLKLAHTDDEGEFAIVGIDQTTLGNMVSTTRESVSKTFGDLQKEKIIKYTPRKIIILDYEKLSHYANSTSF